VGPQERRRRFLVALSAGLFVARRSFAQQGVPRIGFLSARTRSSVEQQLHAFHEGLRDAGYTDKKNVSVVYRWADGRFDLLPGLAEQLAAMPVAVLAATGGNASAVAAAKASRGIPVVFAAGGDPVKLGLVRNLSRPGGNVTGVSQITEALEAKRLELLCVLAPAARTVEVLLNRQNPGSQITIREVSAAAEVLKRGVNFVSAATEAEVEDAFAQFARRGSKAVLVATDPSIDNRRAQVIALAARHSIPAMYGWREHAAAGGLMSYGTAATDSYRQVGVYVGRVLSGTRPGDLPVMSLAARLVINRRTAAALGMAVPQELLLRADEILD